VSGARLRVLEEQSTGHFAREAALGLATLDPTDLVAGNLTLRLALSLWMRRSRVGLRAARDALLQLREALISASGIDGRLEPVPLLVADPASCALSLALYIDGLLRRAAHVTATSRAEVAEHALALLED
jgi:hypothetical protein